MLIERSIELHRKKIEPKLGKAIGASRSDVIALEAQVRLQLPAAYLEYLLWMGADYYGVLRGSDCFISHVNDNTQALTDLFEDNHLTELQYRPLVFFMHQGYHGCWFDLSDQSEDPTVFCFNEATNVAAIVEVGKFSDWLYGELISLSENLQ